MLTDVCCLHEAFVWGFLGISDHKRWKSDESAAQIKQIDRSTSCFLFNCCPSSYISAKTNKSSVYNVQQIFWNLLLNVRYHHRAKERHISSIIASSISSSLMEVLENLLHIWVEPEFICCVPSDLSPPNIAAFLSPPLDNATWARRLLSETRSRCSEQKGL